MIMIKRIYEPPSKSDGKRILVDRLWPRGIKKVEARIDEWLKDIAPSNELRKWYSHDPAKWLAFREKFRKELANKKDIIERLRKEASRGRVTLLFSSKNTEINNAVALKEIIEQRE